MMEIREVPSIEECSAETHPVFRLLNGKTPEEFCSGIPTPAYIIDETGIQ